MEPGGMFWNVSGEIAGNLPHRGKGEPGTTRPRRIPQPIMLQRDHAASFQKVVLELRLFGRNVSAVTMWFAGVARKRDGVAPRHASTFRVRAKTFPTPFSQWAEEGVVDEGGGVRERGG